jgi:sucrose-6-phosphate hydrolase SacC (GH32 family)
MWLAAWLLLSVASAEEFPNEMVEFVPYRNNPVFAGTGEDTWDRKIRERGYILREADGYHLWYTGYNPDRSGTKYLGYATSPDGLKWTRYGNNPVFDESWTEDMQVVKHGDTYYMFAEGRHDIAHLLTSKDRVHWQDHGSLDVRCTDGKPLSPGPYGTPTVWIEGPTWYLFYERGDRGIWLATSTDRKVWTNVKDDPVIARGPEPYDKYAVALNQVVKYKGKHYGFSHANDDPKWHGPWTTCVAMSTDLVHWKKYPKNPIIPTDHSSAILVHDGRSYRLHTMHPDVRVYFPRGSSPPD